jgi:hypothetical protein
MSFRRNVIAAALVAAAGALIASPARAQTTTTPDSASIQTLPPIVTTAEREGLLGRIWNMQERRNEVIELERGNRRLKHELRAYDRRIVELELRLQVLQLREVKMKRVIQAIDSATAATRAARLELEARLDRMERIAKGGRSR